MQDGRRQQNLETEYHFFPRIRHLKRVNDQQGLGYIDQKSREFFCRSRINHTAKTGDDTDNQNKEKHSGFGNDRKDHSIPSLKRIYYTQKCSFMQEKTKVICILRFL